MSEQNEIDRINVEQALLDAEIANSRAIDLTKRLVALQAECLRLESELIQAEIRYRNTSQALANIQNSRKFQLLSGIAGILRVFK